ncbi:MAG: class I tRNA ligase family protein [Clostridia bacterium]|nr:class I tRNA ligase family protein [Clostridia bacterium]
MKEDIKRPIFPKRAVITAGMPYGNKELHFGHIGGMFVHADTYARFLRDRIGAENVIFVSGTDCYGSPILESFRKLKESGNTEHKDITEYVESNHIKQKKTLDEYEISLNHFGASGLYKDKEIHRQVSNEVFETLYKSGYLSVMSTPQFFDSKLQILLNGRQVEGRCPFEGCGSDKAYADECALGHQYMPEELIDPKSTLSGLKPEIVDVENWYFRLEDFRDKMQEYTKNLREDSVTRKFIIDAIDEFLKPPVIYVQRKQIDDLEDLEKAFPKHETIDEEKKSSITFVFENLDDRDIARDVLNERQIRYRTGKTLVPFRLSGNIEWGVPVPKKDNLEDLTFWVWPESLWAPISFLKAYLKEKGAKEDEWKKWWQDEDSMVYQFIGEDNIYFYCIAEMAMFAVMNHPDFDTLDMTKIHLPQIIANKHILFMDKKASSSSQIKPPMANDLLQFYTPEQLRMHFISLGLTSKSSSFKPQALLPKEEQEGVDPALKEGNLLTNVFNRLIRSCLYTIQKYNDSKVIIGKVSEEIIDASDDAILEYEKHMYNNDIHRIAYVLDSYVRIINKHWANSIRTAEANDDERLRNQILTDCFHGIKTALLLLHPIAPTGCEKVREYIGFSDKLWSWDYAFSSVEELLIDKDAKTTFLEPKEDFFRKHESQFE